MDVVYDLGSLSVSKLWLFIVFGALMLSVAMEIHWLGSFANSLSSLFDVFYGKVNSIGLDCVGFRRLRRMDVLYGLGSSLWMSVMLGCSL